jgi:capsular exopolysaccharide synthesis family protein
MERLPAGLSDKQVVPAPAGGLEAVVEYDHQPAEPPPVSISSQISRLISAILRYKWLVIAVSLLGTAGSIAATRFIKPEYRASGTVYIESASKERGGPIRPAELLQSDSWIQLIRSFAVLDSVVLRGRLFLTHAPEDSAAFDGFSLAERIAPGRYRLATDETGRRFTLLSAQGVVVDSGTVGDSIGTTVGFRWMPSASILGRNRDLEFTVRGPREASIDVLSRLRPTMAGQDAVFMTVSLTDQQPERVATVLNMILDQFVSLAAWLKKEKLIQVTNDLEKQLRTADSTMRIAETSLQQYRIETITEAREDATPLPSGLSQTQNTVLGNYFNKRTALSALRKDRKAIEDVVRQGLAEGVVPVDPLHTINAVKNAPGLISALNEGVVAENELRAARLKYTDQHKIVQDILARLDELRRVTVPTLAQRLVDQLKADEAVIERELAIEAEELRRLPVRTLTEEKFRRDANSAIGLTQNLQNRLTDARLAELSATPDVSILDRARVPSRPFSNTAPRVILMGVAGSVGFALLLAILLDRLDRRFRYPDQATHDLGLTILGAVPVIPSERGGLRSPTQTAQIVEAFRSIRLNLAHSYPPEGPIIVTVTSPSPGDGKSLVVANLAVSFAEAGYSTLLIDGDTRRGEQYRTFGIERRPGLLDYLDLGLPVDSVMSATSHERLSIIPSGSRMQRGPELLGSSLMAELMEAARRRFQVILIDSPPLGAGVDSFVLSTATGAVAVVLRAGETDRQLAQAKLELLSRLPVRLVGAILNDVEVGFGAYKHYAYEYTHDYQSPSEEALAPVEGTLRGER